MLYIILEKNLKTGFVSAHSVYNADALALDAIEALIVSTDDYSYKTAVVGG